MRQEPPTFLIPPPSDSFIHRSSIAAIRYSFLLLLLLSTNFSSTNTNKKSEENAFLFIFSLDFAAFRENGWCWSLSSFFFGLLYKLL